MSVAMRIKSPFPNGQTNLLFTGKGMSRVRGTGGEVFDRVPFENPHAQGVLVGTVDIFVGVPPEGRTEVQTLSCTAAPGAGSFKLNFGDDTTGALQYNDSAATIQAALEALDGIGAGNVTVSGSIAAGLVVTFANDLDLQDVSLLTVSDSTLTRENQFNEVQTISFAPAPASGTFKLTFQGQETTALQWNDSAATIQTALRALSNINGANVTVAGSIAAGLTLTFVGTLASTNVGQVTVTSSTLQDAGTNEIQTITFAPAPDAGTFKLTFGGQETTALQYNDSAATIQAALRALSTINGANVTVAGSIAAGLTITFVGTLAATNVGPVTVTSNLLTQGGTNEVQTTAVSAAPAAGAFKLAFGGQITTELQFNDSAATVQAALRALSSINGANVTVGGSVAAGLVITFIGTLAKTNVGDVTVAFNSMVDGGVADVAMTINQTTPGVAATATVGTVLEATPGVAIVTPTPTAATSPQGHPDDAVTMSAAETVKGHVAGQVDAPVLDLSGVWQLDALVPAQTSEGGNTLLTIKKVEWPRNAHT